MKQTILVFSILTGLAIAGIALPGAGTHHNSAIAEATPIPIPTPPPPPPDCDPICKGRFGGFDSAPQPHITAFADPKATPTPSTCPKTPDCYIGTDGNCHCHIYERPQLALAEPKASPTPVFNRCDAGDPNCFVNSVTGACWCRIGFRMDKLKPPKLIADGPGPIPDPPLPPAGPTPTPAPPSNSCDIMPSRWCTVAPGE